MTKLLFICFLIFSSLVMGKENQPKKIAVCISPTTASSSVQFLIESGRRHFCRLHEVHYFVLGNDILDIEGDDVRYLAVDRVDRPFKLFHALQGAKKTFEEYDYLFILKAQMVFVASVGDEVFGELIAVQNHASSGKTFPYSSQFYGGKPSAVFDLLKRACHYGMTHLDEKDEEEWINRAFKERAPTRILSPSYAYPENWQLDYPKKIVVAASIGG